MAFRRFLYFYPLLLSAATVPNRYIVELSTEPVASHVAATAVRGVHANLLSAEAVNHRSRVVREQAAVRATLEQNGAQILDQVDTVANALLVRTTEDNPTPWANLPNVIRVTPVHKVSMLLDRAVVVNKIADAWAQLGGPSNAGAGIKIAIIDTGVDVGHPAFRNSPVTAPAGYPLVNSQTDTAFTNNKVIVARSYVTLLDFDPDRSARDRVGHGTALAMITAGGTVAAPLATLTGIAPGAWIGSYKVFGTPNYNDSTNDDAILKALDDAVKDGMDVVNLSLGYSIVQRLKDDVEVQAVERAVQAGVIVVASAGNDGTDANTVSSPGSAPDVIAVGAQENDRAFSTSVQVQGLKSFVSVPGNSIAPAQPVTGQLADVFRLDGSGLACNSLPSGSLNGRVALILRGSCTFVTKLNNAAAAGAVAALIYAAPTAPDAFQMDVGTATLPAEAISNADGLAIQQAIAAGTATTASLSFSLSPLSVDPARLSTFSSVGPNVDYSIKPDLVAVGTNYYVATQSYDTNGEMYSPDGYIDVDGTSFSSPTVAGSAALLKAARPGFTVAQYRSMLINSASALNSAATVQQVGAGSLNAGAALLSTAAIYPTSLSFGIGGAFPQATSTLQVTNTGTAADTFTIAAFPTGSSPAVSLSTYALLLAAGATGSVDVSFGGSNLTPGGYEGIIRVSGANGKAEARVPYWYGVTSNTPVQITGATTEDSDLRNAIVPEAFYFRVTDAAGIPITSVVPTVTVTAGGGTIRAVQSGDVDVPGLFVVNVRLGRTAGVNTFHVQAGSVTKDFSILGQ